MDLKKILSDHNLWLDDDPKGVRANLSNANLIGAKFDLVTADYVVPIVPNLHQKTLAAIEAGTGLEMSSWHGSCGTTHFRAGHAIHLAGDAGYALEKKLGAGAAGALICLASCPQLEGKVPDFNASNEAALTDIQRLAQLER